MVIGSGDDAHDRAVCAAAGLTAPQQQTPATMRKRAALPALMMIVKMTVKL
jgi:hypothetical protein